MVAVANLKTRVDSLTARQWQAIAIVASGCLFEFFDNYVIAFVLAFIVRPWELSFGASAAILLSSGIGGLIGSLVWGAVTDRFGRKIAFAATLVVTASASLALALTPEGNWIYLTIVRAVVGFGVGGFFIPIILVQELVPESRKGFASGILSTAAASGLVFGALSAATLSEVVGWRGLFVLGAMPGFLAIVVMKVLPESPRWLLDKGRIEDARAAMLWAGKDTDEKPTPADDTRQSQDSGKIEIRPLIIGMSCNLGVVTGFYGLAMWSPTLLAQIQEIEATEAARIMVLIASLGMLMRFSIGAVSDRVGRRACGAVAGAIAAVSVVVASLVANGTLLQPDLFWIPLGVTFMFADASFAVLAAYTAEIFPSASRGRSAGISYAAGGVGKIIGPLGFALVMGTQNVIRPEATVESILPAFGFVAVMFLIAAAAYAFIDPRLGEYGRQP